MQNSANCTNTDNTLTILLRYSPLYEKPNPALECKNSKRQPIYRKTQVSVVADMRFRGVASLNQVGATEGHNFGVREQEKRGPKGREQGSGWRGDSHLKSFQRIFDINTDTI